jgi:uncharacterized protein
MADTSNRGFASMDVDRQRNIGSKGGETVRKDREHTAEIGRKGGESLSHEERRRAGEQSRKHD